MRKIPLGNLNSNNPIKTSVKKYHASVLKNALTDKFCSFIEAHRRSTDSPCRKLS